MNFRLRSLSAVALLAVATVASAGDPPPRVSFDADGVLVAGVRPGASIAWLSMTRDRPNDVSRVQSDLGIFVATPSGNGRIPASRAEHARAIWLVADTETAAATHARPASYIPAVSDVEIRAETAKPTIAFTAPAITLLYVRGRGGAWTYNATDGSPADADGVQNGVVTVTLADMVAVRGNAKPPSDTRVGDVVLVIDSRWMRSGKAEVTQ